MILLVILGTLPLFVILPVKDWIEGLSSNLYVVGAALLITGCLLFISDRVRKGRKNERSARLSDALIVGAAQALATCPGLSRSGTTIAAGCFLGFDRKFAGALFVYPVDSSSLGRKYFEPEGCSGR